MHVSNLSFHSFYQFYLFVRNGTVPYRTNTVPALHILSDLLLWGFIVDYMILSVPFRTVPCHTSNGTSSSIIFFEKDTPSTNKIKDIVTVLER